MKIQAPFPWFGGKSRVSDLVWQRFGAVSNYVEPFFGSGAMLLNRPQPFSGPETVNDIDGFVSNFWRSIRSEPDKVAEYADWPVNENDLHARHLWLLQYKKTLPAKLEGDPDYFDAKIAGWWVWGICCWIGSGFCSGNGPWQVIDGQLVHLGDQGRGVNRKLVHLGDQGQGVNRKREPLYKWFSDLAERLRNVRVCCGDWSRVCGPSVTFKHGLTAVFLDPPYCDKAERTENLYTVDNLAVAHAVREWAISEGDNPLMRIALCGYEGEHQMPETWDCVSWKGPNGFQSDSGHKERIWFSPNCLSAPQFEFNFSQTNINP